MKVKYLRLRPVGTLKDGASVRLSGLEFVPENEELIDTGTPSEARQN